MTIANQIAIDPEFSRLIPPLQPDELAQLESNILAEGCRDALVVWRGLLLDGHNRLRICEEHGLPYRTIEIDLPDREAAADWIDANQLGRRNLSPDNVSLLRGRRYERTKGKQGGDHKSKGQIDTLVDNAEVLARQYGVSAPTIKRDGQFARAVEELKPFVPDIQERVMSGYIPSRQAVIEAAQEPETAEQKLTKAHVSYNSGDNEWYTPPEYIKAAVHVMGGIDLDPASTETANTVVGAARFYTREDDGLKQDWTGRAWLNPAPCSCNVRPIVIDCKHGNQDLLALSEGLAAHARLFFDKNRDALLEFVVQGLPEGVSESSTTGAPGNTRGTSQVVGGEETVCTEREGPRSKAHCFPDGQSQTQAEEIVRAVCLDDGTLGAGQDGMGGALRVLRLRSGFDSGSFHSFITSCLSRDGSLEHGPCLPILQCEQGESDARRLVQGQAARCPNCGVVGYSIEVPSRIFLNPPYSSFLIVPFINKLVKERGHYDQAVVLVNNATETKWFQSLLSIATAVCLPEGRVRFWAPDKVSSTPLQGQAIIYIGENVKAFEFGFGSFGTVLFA